MFLSDSIRDPSNRGFRLDYYLQTQDRKKNGQKMEIEGAALLSNVIRNTKDKLFFFFFPELRVILWDNSID